MKKKICIVLGNYYEKIGIDLLNGATETLKENGVDSVERKIYVPGVFEIPVVIAKNIIDFDAFIALGCVIKGETPHFEFISRATIFNIRDGRVSGS